MLFLPFYNFAMNEFVCFISSLIHARKCQSAIIFLPPKVGSVFFYTECSFVLEARYIEDNSRLRWLKNNRKICYKVFFRISQNFTEWTQVSSCMHLIQVSTRNYSMLDSKIKMRFVYLLHNIQICIKIINSFQPTNFRPVIIGPLKSKVSLN